MYTFFLHAGHSPRSAPTVPEALPETPAEALAEGAPEAALPLAEVPPEAPPVELGVFRSRINSGPCSAGGERAGALADGCEFAAPDQASAAASLSEIESPAGSGGATGAGTALVGGAL